MSHRRSRYPSRLAFIRAGLLLLVFGLSGCSSAPPLRPTAKYVDPQRYPQVLEQHTRGAELYHELETRLLARGTLLTPEFRRAYAAEYARVYRLDQAAQGALMAKVDQEIVGDIEVVVWVASYDLKFAALEPEREIWRLELSDGEGPSVVPSSVTLVRKPSKVDQYFYPYLSALGRTYRLRFPRATADGRELSDGRPLILQFAGVMGVTGLRWELDGGKPSGSASNAAALEAISPRP